MLEYICKRILLAVFTLLVILFVSYALTRLARAIDEEFDDWRRRSGQQRNVGGQAGTYAQPVYEEKLHLDDPIAVGFGSG
jgi:ABC-type dipeptide/oligopeptide/nickel transport system permease component